MATYDPTPPALAGERFCLLIAPSGPVSHAVAVMAADADLYPPQFTASRLDRTALAVSLCGLICWLAPAALWFGGLL